MSNPTVLDPAILTVVKYACSKSTPTAHPTIKCTPGIATK